MIINSLYGIDRDIGGVIAALTEMKEKSGAVVRMMVHDFHLACPSQHLLDYSQKYCGLPANSEACQQCVRDNQHISQEWRELFRLTTWRLQSQSRLDLCDEVRFFDPSGEEILSSVLEVHPHVRTLTPHVTTRNLRRVDIGAAGPLTIVILGSLTYAKGVDVVNALADYVQRKGLDCRMILMGEARSAVDPFVWVHGAYQRESLPQIIEAHGVNVIFICSVVPETFCYTLSEAMQMELPVVAFDLGAQGNRVRAYERGKVVPLGAEIQEIFEVLSDCRRRNASVGRS